jgi:hypothetical protein
MEHNFTSRIIKPSLPSEGSFIIGSEKEKFEKKIKENSERLNRIEKLIIENKELYFQGKEKTKWATELIITNREFTFQSGEKVNLAGGKYND